MRINKIEFFGLVLICIGMVIFACYAFYAFYLFIITLEIPLIIKVPLVVIIAGVVIILLSLVRERLKEVKK